MHTIIYTNNSKDRDKDTQTISQRQSEKTTIRDSLKIGDQMDSQGKQVEVNTLQDTLQLIIIRMCLTCVHLVMW